MSTAFFAGALWAFALAAWVASWGLSGPERLIAVDLSVGLASLVLALLLAGRGKS